MNVNVTGQCARPRTNTHKPGQTRGHGLRGGRRGGVREEGGEGANNVQRAFISSPQLPCTTQEKCTITLAVPTGSPKVRTRSLLSSSAAAELTHLSPHCSTDTDTHIRTDGPADGSPQVLGRPLFPGQLSRCLLDVLRLLLLLPLLLLFLIKWYSPWCVLLESVRTLLRRRTGQLRDAPRQEKREGESSGTVQGERKVWVGGGA